MRLVGPAVRSVAIHDENRAVEAEPKLAQLQRSVGRPAPVVRDDEVRAFALQALLHGVRDGQASGIDAGRRRLEPFDLDTTGRVFAAPRSVEPTGDRRVREKQLDVVPEIGEGEREERRRRPRAARSDEPEELVRHEHDPLRSGHGARVHTAFRRTRRPRGARILWPGNDGAQA